MNQITKHKREDYWRAQLKAIKEYPGTLTDYCQTHGITMSAYHYWLRKLKPKPSESALLPRQSSFVPVEIIGEYPKHTTSSLPDPRWVAEIILNLSRDRS